MLKTKLFTIFLLYSLGILFPNKIEADHKWIKHKKSSHVISYYGKKFHGKKTANGEKFNMHALTAAHKSLPINSIIKVINIKNGKDVLVRINDRGPYIKGRELDLSKAAFEKISDKKLGLIKEASIVIVRLGKS